MPTHNQIIEQYKTQEPQPTQEEINEFEAGMYRAEAKAKEYGSCGYGPTLYVRASGEWVECQPCLR